MRMQNYQAAWDAPIPFVVMIVSIVANSLSWHIAYSGCNIFYTYCNKRYSCRPYADVTLYCQSELVML